MHEVQLIISILITVIVFNQEQRFIVILQIFGSCKYTTFATFALKITLAFHSTYSTLIYAMECFLLGFIFFEVIPFLIGSNAHI